MLILDAANPTPILVRKPMPTFKNQLEEDRWWGKEFKYWTEGFGSVPGMMYWYHSQVTLKNRISGELFRPDARDADLLIFSELEDSYKKGESLFIIKGRGVGLSSIGMNMPHYFHRVYPGSKCIATSKDKTTLGTLFNDKTMPSFEGLHKRIQPDLINKNQTKSESYLKVGFSYVTNEDREAYAECEFICRDTQDNDKAATAFSGSGSIFGFADEAPLMPRFQKFFDSAREVFTNHSMNRMEGLLFSGGTCEDTMKPEDVSRVMDVWQNAKAMHIRPIFIPATYGKFMTNGHSDHKKAEEEILKRREELSSMPDSLRAYIKNNPLTIDEIFSIGRGGRWEDDNSERLIQQEKIIINNTKPENKFLPYVLTRMGQTVTAQPKKGSSIEIMEFPKQGVRYYVGIDGTATSKMSSDAKKNDQSKFAVVIIKGYDPTGKSHVPVATLLERPEQLEQTYLKAANMIWFYHVDKLCKVSAEGNAGTAEHFGAFLANDGLKSALMSRKRLDASDKVQEDKLFFYRDAATLDWQYRQANIHLRRYGHDFWSLPLIRDMMRPESENADLVDAYLAALVGMGISYDKPVQQKKIYKSMKAKHIFDPQRGWIIEWEEV